MSLRNGDRARFQKERMRRVTRRQRLQELFKTLRPEPPAPAGVAAAVTAGRRRSPKASRAGNARVV